MKNQHLQVAPLSLLFLLIPAPKEDFWESCSGNSSHGHQYFRRLNSSGFIRTKSLPKDYRYKRHVYEYVIYSKNYIHDCSPNTFRCLQTKRNETTCCLRKETKLKKRPLFSAVFFGVTGKGRIAATSNWLTLGLLEVVNFFTWICLRCFLAVLPWQITMKKPPFGRICFKHGTSKCKFCLTRSFIGWIAMMLLHQDDINKDFC